MTFLEPPIDGSYLAACRESRFDGSSSARPANSACWDGYETSLMGASTLSAKETQRCSVFWMENFAMVPD